MPDDREAAKLASRKLLDLAFDERWAHDQGFYAGYDAGRASLSEEEVELRAIVQEMVDWFGEHDGKADDFGRLRFVARANDNLDIYPARGDKEAQG